MFIDKYHRIRIGTGDTPHCEAVAAVVVVRTWVHVAAIDVQVVRLSTIVRRTRPPVAVRVAGRIIESTAVDVPGIGEMSPHTYRDEAHYALAQVMA